MTKSIHLIDKVDDPIVNSAVYFKTLFQYLQFADMKKIKNKLESLIIKYFIWFWSGEGRAKDRSVKVGVSFCFP